MDTLKISESVLKRSVLKPLQKNKVITKKGADVGLDCAFFSSFAGACADFELQNPAEIRYPIIRAINNLACGSIRTQAVFLNLFLPEETAEEELADVMEAAAKAAAECGVVVAGGDTKVCPGAKRILAGVTAVGGYENRMSPADKAQPGGKTDGRARPGDALVASKWVGLEGTALLAERYAGHLQKRYPSHMIEEAGAFAGRLSILPEAAIAAENGVSAMHDASSGGIFAALWEMAECAGIGLRADLKKIPIRQETVELCEFFGINPYELLSGGCLLMAAPDGEKLVEGLLREGVKACIIGRFEEGNDRVVMNEEEKRYLERPKGDALAKILIGRQR